MKQTKEPNLDIFTTFDIEKRELLILTHWAEHRCFKRADIALEDSVGSGRLREAVSALGGGMMRLLDDAVAMCKNLPNKPQEDVDEKYDWKIADVTAKQDELNKLSQEGWLAGDSITNFHYHFRRRKIWDC